MIEIRNTGAVYGIAAHVARAITLAFVDRTMLDYLVFQFLINQDLQ